MKAIDVKKAASLKDLVRLAYQESEVLLTQDNKPVAKVVPITSLPSPADGTLARRKLGLNRGAWSVGNEFDAPLPDEFWLGEE